MQTNFQEQMDIVLKEIQANKKRPSLLLHSCCAPCSSYVLEYLTPYFQIKLLFFNPNISPAEEFDMRLREQKRMIHEMGLEKEVDIIQTDYCPEDFQNIAIGLEKEKEGGARCEKCFRLRLERAAQTAKRENCDFFTTTLSVSPLKNAAMLNQIGCEFSKKYGIPYLVSDFKKRGGYQRTIELSRKYQLYRQKFCGCEFSRREAEKQGRI